MVKGTEIMIGGNKCAPLCRWEEAISRAMQGQGENSVVISSSCASAQLMADTSVVCSGREGGALACRVW